MEIQKYSKSTRLMPRIDIDKLKKLRAAIPLTQPELAEKIGLKRSTYAYKEKIGEFTETEIQKLVRIFQIERSDLLEVSGEVHESGSHYNGNSPNNAGPPVDELIKAKDETIQALNKTLNFLEEENKRLKLQCERNLGSLSHYAQIISARVHTILESHILLRAVAHQAKVDQKKMDVSSQELDTIYQSILENTIQSDKD